MDNYFFKSMICIIVIMFWKILGMMDFFAGLFILFSSRFAFEGNIILLLLMLVMFGKGAWSVWGSISYGNYLNWMGYVDLASFFLLFMIFYGSSIAVPGFIIAMIFFKATYSLLLVLF